MPDIEYRQSKEVPLASVLELYRANDWASADKPELLHNALQNSHALVTAWNGSQLIGLANAISDGYLVVYYPHVVVHPDYHRQGTGQAMMKLLMQQYAGFHQHSIIADKAAVTFFESCGFERSPCEAMWIYDGADH